MFDNFLLVELMTHCHATVQHEVTYRNTIECDNVVYIIHFEGQQNHIKGSVIITNFLAKSIN